jgi:hypothetical protein
VATVVTPAGVSGILSVGSMRPFVMRSLDAVGFMNKTRFRRQDQTTPSSRQAVR